MENMGKGLSQLGQTGFAIAGMQAEEAKRERDFMNRLSYISAEADLTATKIKWQDAVENETDPVKLAELKAEFPKLIANAGAGIADPRYKAQWEAKAKVLTAHGEGVVQAKEKKVWIAGATSNGYRQIDELANLAARSDDPNAQTEAVGRSEEIIKHLEPLVGAEKARELREKTTQNIVIGRLNWLRGNGRYEDAASYLDTVKGVLDVDKLPGFRNVIDNELEKAQRDRERANEKGYRDSVWGGSDKGYAGPKTPGGGGVPVLENDNGTPGGGRVGGWSSHGDAAVAEFRKLGWSDAAIKGVLANGFAEGGFKQPWIQSGVVAGGKREESFGHWQLNRRGELPNYLANEGKDNPQDSRAQARFIARRMEEIHPGFGKLTDPNKASDVVLLDFEKPADKEGKIAERRGLIRVAEQYMGRSGATNSAQPLTQVASARPATMTDALPAEAASSLGGLPPRRDIEGMLRRIQTDADSGNISQESANRVSADIRESFNREESFKAQGRATLTRKIQNIALMLEDGQDVDYDKNELYHFLPKEQVDEQVKFFEEAKEVGQVARGIKNTSISDLQTQREQLIAGLNDKDPDNYQKRRRMVLKFEEASKKHIQSLMGPQADTARYVEQNSPHVAQLYTSINPQEPGSFENYATATLTEQARLGVPEEARTILPDTAASQAVKRITSFDPVKEKPGEVMSQIAQSYGSYWPQVFKELAKAKLPATYQVLASMDHPKQQVVASHLSDAISLMAEKGGFSILKKSIPDDVQKEIDKSLDDNLSDFRESVRYQREGMELYGRVRDSAQALAYYYGFQGKSASESASAAIDGILNTKWDIKTIDGSMLNAGSMVRVPKGEAGIIERAAYVVKQALKPDDFGPIPHRRDILPEDAKREWVAAIKEGGWVNNEDDDGIVLQGLFHDGARHVVRRKDGSRIEVKFSDAPSLVARFDTLVTAPIPPIPPGDPVATAPIPPAPARSR
jgi:hypothetical protein